jgi:pilus assembly protein CpaB
VKRKIVGIAAALALALIGTMALVAYVNSARDEAAAGEDFVEVWVLNSALDQGATMSEIRAAVRPEEVPLRLRADDAVTDIDALDDGLVAGVDLVKGEQLLASRLVKAESLVRAEVPPRLQELTVALAAERAVGGVLKPGDTVGVVLSFDPFEVGEAGASAGGAQPAPDGSTATSAPQKTPNTTHLTFHKVPVTFVQLVDNGQNTTDDTDSTIQTAPSVDVLVTLGLTAPQVEQVVFAAEFGHVWLTLEGADADESGTRIVTLGEVYQPAEAG